MPDGKMTPQEFAAKVRAKYPGAYDSVSDVDLTQRVLAKYPQYSDSVQMTPQIQGGVSFYARKFGQVASDLLQGVGEGVLQTPATISGMLNKIPVVGETLAPKEGVEAFKKIATPDNTTQRIGAGLEQAAELALPTGEIGAAAKAAGKFGKAARIGTTVLANAGVGGANAALHGESPTAGAVSGGIGAAAGEAASAVAPKIAESGIGVWVKDRLRGKTPGAALLQETKGFSPETVAATADDKLAELTHQLEKAAGESQVPARLNDAISAIDDEIGKATAENSASTVKKLNQIKKQLTVDITTDQPFPEEISPLKALQLKRGIGKLIKTWNPEEQSSVQSAVERLYGALNNEIERSVPAAGSLNERMASLIPVGKRAENAAAGPGVVGSIVEKLRRPTGALAASAVGAGLGYEKGGTEGALEGAALGLAPALVVNPSTMITAARAMNSPLLKKTIPIGQGLFLQAIRTDEEGNIVMKPVQK